MRGVQRTIAIFECFSPQRPRLTLQEIANNIGLAKSTTFRIVQSLERMGYLIRLEDQKYCLSFRFTRLAGSVMTTLSVRQVARPTMLELARRTNETVTLNMASGRDRVCIEVIDTPSPLMSMARQGQNVPLTGKGATGKVLMAHMAPKEADRIVAHATRNPEERAAITKELARVRKAGYCISHGERVLGLSAVAAPIWASDGSAPYCIAITAPTVRLKPRIDEFVKALMESSRDISRRLGSDVEMPAMHADVEKPGKATRAARAPRHA